MSSVPSQKPRRRSVHFGATQVVDGGEEVAAHVDDVETPEEKRLRAALYSRRKSAPDGAAVAATVKAQDRDWSQSLRALDPELRRSLTRLCATTPLENPEGDLDGVINHKLLGRDELEVYRLKMAKKQASSIAHANAMSASEVIEEEGGDSIEVEMSSSELLSLVRRLEAVTTRLEAVQGGQGAASELRLQVEALKRNPADIGRIVEALEARAAGGETSNESPSAVVSAFDEAVASGDSFKKYLDLSAKLGGDIATHAQMVSRAVAAQRSFLELASKSRQPKASELQALLKPMSDVIAEIQSFREANRRSQYFNHLSTVSESIPALGWVAVSPAPSPFVKEMNDAGQFYTNRVLKEFKDKDRSHAEWVKAWISTLSELQAYVKQHHTTGLVWNPKGGDPVAAAPKAAPAGGPPLPPPPPPPGLFDDIKAEPVNPEKAARNALFADINQGEAVTKGLKKVTADMQTHKNPQLRQKPAIGPKPGSSQKPGWGGPKAAPPAAQKPPKMELEGKKWMVENIKNNPNVTIEKAEVNQSVYAFRCENSTIRVQGKCNNIILDSCKKCGVVFDSAVSAVEFINCQSVQMQVLGSVPTVSIDKTDGCQMYLSKDSLSTVIISAKSSEMNVLIPDGNDYVEQPVPEQFRTVVENAKLKTSTSETV